MKVAAYAIILITLLGAGVGLATAPGAGNNASRRVAAVEDAPADQDSLRTFHANRRAEPERLGRRGQHGARPGHPGPFTITVTGPKGKVVFQRKVAPRQLRRMRAFLEHHRPRTGRNGQRPHPRGPGRNFRRGNRHFGERFGPMPPEARTKIRVLRGKHRLEMKRLQLELLEARQHKLEAELKKMQNEKKKPGKTGTPKA